MSNALSDSAVAGTAPGSADAAEATPDSDMNREALQSAAGGRSRRKRRPSTRHRIRRLMRRHNRYMTMGRWLLGLILLALMGWLLINYIYPVMMGSLP